MRLFPKRSKTADSSRSQSELPQVASRHGIRAAEARSFGVPAVATDPDNRAHRHAEPHSSGSGNHLMPPPEDPRYREPAHMGLQAQPYDPFAKTYDPVIDRQANSRYHSKGDTHRTIRAVASQPFPRATAGLPAHGPRETDDSLWLSPADIEAEVERDKAKAREIKKWRKDVARAMSRDNYQCSSHSQSSRATLARCPSQPAMVGYGRHQLSKRREYEYDRGLDEGISHLDLSEESPTRVYVAGELGPYTRLGTPHPNSKRNRFENAYASEYERTCDDAIAGEGFVPPRY